MSEAVTVPSLMMMTSVVSKEVLVRNTQTDRHTHTGVSSKLKFAKSLEETTCI